ncbi:unnamed protein product [Rotaria sordida]|uniref:Uncharacterized protein n=1 Tax=Rotaria sordida TaxID=392033 RepID=A0A819R6J1_9BILA|nr:unnamed protein product [Rotaria sordida]CAF1477092.1 unnamed protein product [Rotaria sordida]CAF3949079.1 unnamed protein product [Rotaria sordida]CAF4042542.1 unnamed protein product [Rotaria sordida]
MPVHTTSCRNSDSILEQPSETDAVPKLIAADNSITLKKPDEPLEYSHVTMNKSFISTQLVTVGNLNNAKSIWPIGISHQPDFVEIVVTDEEMNAYWDTLKDSF